MTDLLEMIIKGLTGSPIERKYCDLNFLLNTKIDNVKTYQDGNSLKKDCEPKAAYIFFKQQYVGTAYQNKLVMGERFDQNNEIKNLFNQIEERFYSTY
jgi:hypothetical protein